MLNQSHRVLNIGVPRVCAVRRPVRNGNHRSNFTRLSLLALALILPACTAHPRGESAERDSALTAGKPYSHPIEQRHLAPLPADATPEQIITYALLSNAGLEQRYWEWRAAIEQIPQDGTQKTDVTLSFQSMITNGETAPAMNTLGIANDPMANLVLPNKLAKSAAIALENARAAGIRFESARFDLREKILTAYADYALSAEQLRLGQANIDLLKLMTKITESRVANATTTQQDLLKSLNESDMATNELAATRAKLAPQLATLNALLNRPTDTPITPPASFANAAPLPDDDAQLLARAAAINPELAAQLHDIAAKRLAIARAKQDFIPDFGVGFSSDLQGITQSVLGSVTLPLLRYEAIDASVKQARANLSAVQATRRQATNDLAADVISAITRTRDSDRQIQFLEKTFLPRAQQIVTSVQSNYSTGNATLLDLLDSQRSLITTRQLLADLKADHAKSRAHLETLLHM